MPKKNSGSAGWVTTGITWGIAAGVALGALVVAPAMAPIADNSFNNIEPRSGEVEAEGDAAQANPQADSANALLSQVSTDIVEGTLTRRPFIVIRTPDADKDDVETTRWLAEMAGGTVAGDITLTDKFVSQDGADELRSIVANTLPAGAQLSVDNQAPGIHAGESLGAALMYDPATDAPLASVEDRAVVLQALRDAGFIEYADGTVTPAQGIIVVTGGGTDGKGGKSNEDGENSKGKPSEADVFASTVVADVARGLDSRGDAVVLAGRLGAAVGEGSVEQIRKDPDSNAKVSTVDSLDTETGRISAVLALAEQIAGGSGAYGSAENAQAPAPERPKRR